MRKLLTFSLFFLLVSCGGKKVEPTPPDASNLDEPDRVLFERAMNDLERNKLSVARLTLQTLINSYPDSPRLDEAKRTLRAVQEVLAEGVYRIGNFYFLKKSYPAAADRYREVLTKYPDFTGVPDALFNLAESLRHNNNEPESAIYYARIVSDHPHSERVNDAKQRLTEMNQPVPEPNPVALARTQQVPVEDRGLFSKIFSPFNRRPPVPITDSAAGQSSSPSNDGENKDGGSFDIDPKVVQPKK